MAISYKLEKFEGPLDLLLHLIDKNKVDIYDIPIVEITRQYLEYVNQMEREDLNIVSDFLVMAATLLDIKSRMLLPAKEDEEGEEEDPRAELVARLLEYKRYKMMAQELLDLEEDAQSILFKPPTVPKEVAKYEPPVDLDQLLDGLTLAKLQRIFEGVMKRQEDKVDPIRSSFGTIKKEPVSLEERVMDVLRFARKKRRFSFRQMLTRQGDKLEIVVTFLAVLELMKVGKLSLTQEHTFDDMEIEILEKEGEETEPELDLQGLEEDGGTDHETEIAGDGYEKTMGG
ncbi:segregation/condensation protein A [bacterium D16-54]|nr:segregation/condensation protein A [bacterium D16-54]RKJ15296.1 segregation/condensation protein A [bacterium D16-56]